MGGSRDSKEKGMGTGTTTTAPSARGEMEREIWRGGGGCCGSRNFGSENSPPPLSFSRGSLLDSRPAPQLLGQPPGSSPPPLPACNHTMPCTYPSTREMGLSQSLRLHHHSSIPQNWTGNSASRLPSVLLSLGSESARHGGKSFPAMAHASCSPLLIKRGGGGKKGETGGKGIGLNDSFAVVGKGGSPCPAPPLVALSIPGIAHSFWPTPSGKGGGGTRTSRTRSVTVQFFNVGGIECGHV